MHVRPGKASLFSRRQTCRGKSQKPCSSDSRMARNQDPEPVDTISLGEITSHRAVTKVDAIRGLEIVYPRVGSPHALGEDSMGSRI